jgi:Cys-tRNA(Pro)/Cys-tRNA(Cys) deacylase
VTARSTPALDVLARSGVAHTLHPYEASPRHGRARDERPRYGEEAAAALGVGPERVFKTLVASVDERPALVIVPSDREVDLKALATALGGRRAQLVEPAVAERITGSVVGGISPLGLRRRLPVVLDRHATEHATVLVSAGRRGLQVELAPADLARLTGATTCDVARPR